MNICFITDEKDRLIEKLNSEVRNLKEGVNDLQQENSKDDGLEI